jgi:glycosyltransferase involved in cell wall biosynthesis
MYEIKSELTLSLVVPVFNKQEAVHLFLEKISDVFSENNSILLEIVFVNDGSSDATLDRLLSYQKTESRLKVVDLSRNFGKEAALTAGLQMAKGSVIVPIDVDLQDPPELILEIVVSKD